MEKITANWSIVFNRNIGLNRISLLSGFFSKDEILVSVWESGHIVLFIVALLTSILTAFYMFRLFFIVFWGTSRNETKDVQESPGSMTAPMMILAVLSIFVGYVNTLGLGRFLEIGWLKGTNIWAMYI